jgi:hypothetical protein
VGRLTVLVGLMIGRTAWLAPLITVAVARLPTFEGPATALGRPRNAKMEAPGAVLR